MARLSRIGIRIARRLGRDLSIHVKPGHDVEGARVNSMGDRYYIDRFGTELRKSASRCFQNFAMPVVP